MVESNTIRLIETIFSDKSFADVENTRNGTYIPIPDFTIDQLIVKFGLKTIAVKNLISLRICLQDAVKKSIHNYNTRNKETIDNKTKLASKLEDLKYPYASYIINLLKIDQPLEILITQYYTDKISNLIIRTIRVFEEANKNYKINAKTKGISVVDHPVDLIHGGECNVLELLFITTTCINKDIELCEDFIPKILPNNIPEFASPEEERDYLLRFAQMKICLSISKLGKNVRYMYDKLDEDKNGNLSPSEIIRGLKDKFNVYFSDEEAANLCYYLDIDNSGDVDFDEFSAKINYNDYNKNYTNYTITKTRFIKLVLEQWEKHEHRIQKRLIQIFEKFDDNGDGVLTFEEFKVLVNNLDPNLNQQAISYLFNETLDSMEPDGRDEEDMDKMSPEAFCDMAIKNKLGGYGKDFFENYINQVYDKSQAEKLTKHKQKTTD